jgi:hypothetical protein
MPTPATYDDVNLILRPYEVRREEKMRVARDWFTRQFHVHSLEEYQKLCPFGTDQTRTPAW